MDKNGERLPGNTPRNEEGELIVAELSAVWKPPDHESLHVKGLLTLGFPVGTDII